MRRIAAKRSSRLALVRLNRVWEADFGGGLAPYLFDDFIGLGQDQGRERQVQGLGHLQIDDEFEARRQLDR